MRMIYYLSHLTSVHINKSAADFKNSSAALFLSEMDNDDDDLLEEKLSNEGEDEEEYKWKRKWKWKRQRQRKR